MWSRNKESCPLDVHTCGALFKAEAQPALEVKVRRVKGVAVGSRWLSPSMWRKGSSKRMRVGRRREWCGKAP